MQPVTRPAPTIVFDLDGTLIDTAPDLIDTLNAVFAREGVPPVPYAEGRVLIGGGARTMILRGLEAEGRSADTADIDKLFADFIDHYSRHIADRSRPFPGLLDALDVLTARGYRLAVCTNKLEGLSRLLLDALDLTGRFATICGQDTYGMQKPDPQVLRHTVAAAGGDMGHAIMVGDSITDVRVARNAGIPVVAVDFGYTEIPPHELGSDRLIGSFDELPAVIAELLVSK